MDWQVVHLSMVYATPESHPCVADVMYVARVDRGWICCHSVVIARAASILSAAPVCSATITDI
jgi:hypothetical protein